MWFGFRVNWVSVPIFLVLGIVIALYAKHVFGGWTRPWISIKPVWWFLLVAVVPPLGFILLAVNLYVYRQAPGAITGRSAAK